MAISSGSYWYNCSVMIHRNYDSDAYTEVTRSGDVEVPQGSGTYVHVTLPSSPYSRTGYSFNGYGTSGWDTSPAYRPGDTVEIYVGSSGNQYQHVYCLWVRSEHTVTFNANGGSNAPSAQTFQVGSSVTLSSATPTRTGYRLLGWSQNQNATTESYAPGSTQTFDGNVTLYAVWTRQTYTITFNANGGINAPAAQTKTYGIDLTLASDVPTREGYAFVGWAKSNTATIADYVSGDTYAENGNATLYAVWSLITANHTLTYNANGGTGAPASETKTFSVEAPTLFTVSDTLPARIGHTFKGWASASGSTTVEYSAGDTIPASEDKTLYAVWEIITYPVVYDANGGVGAPAAQAKTYDVSLTLSASIPTRDGYDFLGWAESADATVPDYQAGGSYTKNEAKTLYAVWKKKTYTVHYDAAGGFAAPADQTKIHGETLVLSSYVPKLQGYRFRGWGLAPNAQNIAYAAGDDYTANAPITLYALWRRSMYAGVYVVQDGKPMPAGVYL